MTEGITPSDALVDAFVDISDVYHAGTKDGLVEVQIGWLLSQAAYHFGQVVMAIAIVESKGTKSKKAVDQLRNTLEAAVHLTLALTYFASIGVEDLNSDFLTAIVEEELHEDYVQVPILAANLASGVLADWVESFYDLPLTEEDVVEEEEEAAEESASTSDILQHIMNHRRNPATSGVDADAQDPSFPLYILAGFACVAGHFDIDFEELCYAAGGVKYKFLHPKNLLK